MGARWESSSWESTRGTGEDAPPIATLEAGGAQVVVAANARLDNRSALGSELGLTGDLPSDADLIAGSYLRWGAEFASHLLGDFVIAVHDGRDGSLVCARDGPGARVLYLHLGRDRCVFASEIGAVLAHGGIDDAHDERKIADYLGQVFVDRSATFFREVRRLPPGHTVRVHAGRVDWHAHWELPDLRAEPASDEAHAARFGELFEEAVRCRVRGTRRPGVLLSGGLDSSSIVGILRERRERWGVEGLPVLSARFPGFPTVDEGSYIDEVVAAGHLEPHSVSATESSPLAHAEAVLEEVHEPFFSPNLYVHRLLVTRARELGIDVLLDGVDGDTTVGHGLEWIGELVARGRLRRALVESRALARRFRRPTLRFLWHFGVQPGVLAPAAHALRAIVGRTTPRPPAFVAPDLARRVDWSARLRDILRDRLAPPRTWREVHRRALTSDLIPHFLELDERVSSSFGIDSRHPYFDRRLLEFSYSLPPEQKVAEGWDRVVQRRAAEGLIPERIRGRLSKSRWDGPFMQGFLDRDRDRIRDLVAHTERVEAYCDPGALEAAWGRCEAGRGSDEDTMGLWLAVTLDLWLRGPGRFRGMKLRSGQEQR